MKRASTGTWTDGWFALSLAVIVSVVSGAAFFWSNDPWTLLNDNRTTIFPLVTDAFHIWTSGRIPIWTGSYYAGYPLLAEPTAGVFYLPHLLSFSLSPHPHLRAFDISSVLHLGLLASGTFVLARRLGAARIASLLSVALMMMSVYVFIYLAFYHHYFVALCWFPWLLASADALARNERGWGRHVVFGSLALALQVLGGYAQLALYTGLIAAAFLLVGRSVVPMRSRLWRCALLLGCAGLLAGANAIPTWMELPYAFRTELAVSQTSLGVRFSLLGLIDPCRTLGPIADLFLSPFLGLATGILATLALLRRARRSGLMVVVALMCALLSAGGSTPLWEWLWRLPGFGLFRGPWKFYGITVFMVVCLSSLGLQELWRIKERARVAAVLAALLSVGALLEYGVRLDQIIDQRSYARPLLRASLSALKEALPSLVRDETGEGPPYRVLVIGREQLPVGEQLPVAYGIEMFPTGQPPLLNRAYGQLRLWVFQARERGLSPDRMDLFGVDRVFLFGPCRQLSDTRLRVEKRGEGYCVLRNPQAPARYSLLRNARRVTSASEMLQWLRKNPRGPVPVVAPLGAIHETRSPNGPPGHVELQSYRPGAARMLVSTDEDTLLFARESWAAGWKARIDGQPVPIFRAAGVFFAIPVSAGEHEVELVYTAPGLTLGLAGAGVWVLLAIGLLALDRRSRSTLQDQAQA